MSADFLSEAMKTKRKWYNIIQVLKEKKSTQNPITSKIFYGNEVESKIFSNKGKWENLS